MGIGPVPATRAVLQRTRGKLDALQGQLEALEARLQAGRDTSGTGGTHYDSDWIKRDPRA